ncbi:MAG: CRISPR-associated endonuclease Cas2 [wastewater metagenome]|nr:CRISPR-associated endonuclease Cas2 [Candidatus Loosdrechtia aerotolerans]
MKSNYIVCYDITDAKRLRRVFKTLKGIGTHIQYSVFFCKLTWQELTGLKEELKGIIDSNKDDIRIYPLPSNIRCVVLGQGDRIPEGVEIFL